jgi:hypothetical protein
MEELNFESRCDVLTSALPLKNVIENMRSFWYDQRQRNYIWIREEKDQGASADTFHTVSTSRSLLFYVFLLFQIIYETEIGPPYTNDCTLIYFKAI